MYPKTPPFDVLSKPEKLLGKHPYYNQLLLSINERMISFGKEIADASKDTPPVKKALKEEVADPKTSSTQEKKMKLVNQVNVPWRDVHACDLFLLLSARNIRLL